MVKIIVSNPRVARRKDLVKLISVNKLKQLDSRAIFKFLLHDKTVYATKVISTNQTHFPPETLTK